MTSEDNKNDDELSMEMLDESIEVDEIYSNDLSDDLADLDAFVKSSSNEDIDSAEEYVFDADEKSQKTSSIKKFMAPLVVLAVAAGVGGAIVTNPDLLAQINGNQTQQQTNTFGVDNTEFNSHLTMNGAEPSQQANEPVELSAETVDLPQPFEGVNDAGAEPVAVTADVPELPSADVVENAAVTADEIAEESSVITVALTAEDNAQTGTDAASAIVSTDAPQAGLSVDINTPVSDDSAALSLFDAPTESEDVVTETVSVAETAQQYVEATKDAALLGQDVSTDANSSPVSEQIVVAQASEGLVVKEVAEADIPVIEVIEQNDVDVPRMPEDQMAPIGGAQVAANPVVSNNVMVPVVTSAPTESAPNPHGTIGIAQEGDYFDSNITLPRGGQVNDTMRVVDPKSEPGQRLVIAKKDYSKSSQESLIEAASRALQLQRYDAALEMYEQLYSKNKRDHRILMGLAVSQQYTGRADSAIQTYEALLDLDPKNADALVNMMGLIRQQYPEIALRRLLELQDRFPNNAGLVAQIGVTQADLGNYKDAVRYLEIASSLEPRNAQHPFNIAVIAERRGAVADAIRYYEEALQTDAVYGGSRSIPRDQVYDRLAKLRRR
jgi:Flp pilus assembly protein TadD